MKGFFAGFQYAAQGISAALRTERNMRFHLCAGLYVLGASFFFGFSALEYALLFLCIGGVMALELMNSAVERAVDKPDTAHWHAAGAAKDMAAGAVLVLSIAAAAVGVCLFWQPQRWYQIFCWFIAHPMATVGLAVSLAGAGTFVFYPRKKG